MSKYICLSSVLISVRAQAEDFASYTYPTYPFTIKFPIDWGIQDTKLNATGVLFKSGYNQKYHDSLLITAYPKSYSSEGKQPDSY
jgi:hypothetical protein